MDVGPAVSLLRYAKGDRGCPIMRLIFTAAIWSKFLWKQPPLCRLGPSSLAALAIEADAMRGCQDWRLWPMRRRPLLGKAHERKIMDWQ
jgi:hypothetical protein